MNIIIVYITNPNRKTAEKIALLLLKKKLIACANILSTDSLYYWKKKYLKEKEYIVLAKTLEKNYLKIKKEIEKNHPYKIPCVLKINGSANEKYFTWLKKEVK